METVHALQSKISNWMIIYYQMLSEDFRVSYGSICSIRNQIVCIYFIEKLSHLIFIFCNDRLEFRELLRDLPYISIFDRILNKLAFDFVNDNG